MIRSVRSTDMTSQSSRPSRVTIGVLTYIGSAGLVSIWASRSLSSLDYTIFVAFSAIAGVVVQGVSASLEQQVTLCATTNAELKTAWTSHIRRRYIVSASIVILVFIIPVGGWKEVLFGHRTTVVQATVIASIIPLLATAVFRGVAAGQRRYGQLGNSHIVLGATSLTAPIALTAMKVDLLSAFIIGQGISWMTPLFILLPRSSKQDQQVSLTANQTLEQRSQQRAPGLSLTNFSLLSTLLSSQMILRVFTEDFGAEKVAEAQLLITVTCLASTISLGMMPTLISEFRFSRQHVHRGAAQMSIRLVALGVLYPCLVVVFRDPILLILLGRTGSIGLWDSLLIGSQATSLVLGVVQTAKHISLGHTLKSAISWTVTLALLWMLPILGTNSAMTTILMWLSVITLIAPVGLTVFNWKK